MGQDEVFAWLAYQRSIGVERYFTINEIREGLTNDEERPGHERVRRAIWPLVRHGVLEMGMSDDLWNWQRTFRLKRHFIYRELRTSAMAVRGYGQESTNVGQNQKADASKEPREDIW